MAAETRVERLLSPRCLAASLSPATPGRFSVFPVTGLKQPVPVVPSLPSLKKALGSVPSTTEHSMKPKPELQGRVLRDHGAFSVLSAPSVCLAWEGAACGFGWVNPPAEMLYEG